MALSSLCLKPADMDKMVAGSEAVYEKWGTENRSGLSGYGEEDIAGIGSLYYFRLTTGRVAHYYSQARYAFRRRIGPELRLTDRRRTIIPDGVVKIRSGHFSIEENHAK